MGKIVVAEEHTPGQMSGFCIHKGTVNTDKTHKTYLYPFPNDKSKKILDIYWGVLNREWIFLFRFIE